MENEELYQQFIEVSNKISELTARKKTLSDMVMQKFKAEKIEKVEAPNGLITVVSRAKWVYSKNVTDVEKQAKKTIKAIKDLEEEDGTAKNEPTEFLKTTLR